MGEETIFFPFTMSRIEEIWYNGRVDFFFSLSLLSLSRFYICIRNWFLFDENERTTTTNENAENSREREKKKKCIYRFFSLFGFYRKIICDEYRRSFSSFSMAFDMLTVRTENENCKRPVDSKSWWIFSLPPSSSSSFYLAFMVYKR